MSSQSDKHIGNIGARSACILLALCAASGCEVYDRSLLANGEATAADASLMDAAAAVFDAGNSAQPPTAMNLLDAATRDPDGDAGPASSPGPTAADAATAADAPAPIPCAAGECWWSDPLSATCRSTGRPVPELRPAPGAGADAAQGDIYLGWTGLRLGGRDDTGAVSDQVWQTIGMDLDATCTHSSTCADDRDAVACQPLGKAIPFDGELCRDNAFGSLQPLLAALPEQLGFDEAAFNCNLWRGSYTIVMRLSGYDGSDNDPDVRVDIYTSPGLEREATWTCPLGEADNKPPRWSASATWQIDRRDLVAEVEAAGTLPSSLVADPHAYVRDGYLVASIPQGAALRLANYDPRQRGFVMTVSGTTWLGRLGRAQDGSWELQDGVVAGVVLVDDLIQTVRELGTCEGSDYDGALEGINDRADMLASGESDATQSCDALSFGLAFQAAELTPGAAQDAPVSLACCPSGMTSDDCNPVCGDGKVTGNESCDYALSPWERGACPVSCSSNDACTPRMRVGSGCDVRCMPQPITAIGPNDGCCPPGGNARTDPNCPSVCGNGVLEPDETCDPSAGECPMCVSRDACQIAITRGAPDTCDVSCEFEAVEECKLEADGCCPSGCHSLNDGDCVPRCGNGVLEAKELCEAGSSTPCDTLCDDHDPCTLDVRTGSVGSCNLVCRHNPITTIGASEGCCPDGATANDDEDCESICGNHVVEPDETCDDGNQRDGDACPASCQQGN